MRDELLYILTKLGQKFDFYETEDGTGILVLQHGGRILGLFGPRSKDNFLYVNSALSNLTSARTFFLNTDWHNSGGDRTWLAPEVDFFLPKFPDITIYKQQPELDPGNYQIRKYTDKIELSNTCELCLSRAKKKIKIKIAKKISAARNPLRFERGMCDPADKIEYAGYTLNTSIEFMNKIEDEVKIGIWNLLQLPNGGELLIPTYSKTKPTVYFGDIGTKAEIPHGDITTNDSLIRYKMSAPGAFKIGIRAVNSTGRIGYVFENKKKYSLVIRNFFVNPSGEYIDVPWDDTGKLGDAIQACSVNFKNIQFSELEYHVPCVGGSNGELFCEDTSQVWAFRGSLRAIKKIGRVLMSIKI